MCTDGLTKKSHKACLQGDRTGICSTQSHEAVFSKADHISPISQDLLTVGLTGTLPSKEEVYASSPLNLSKSVTIVEVM